MAITADQVKKLREKTGAGMMDCKKALEKCDGDMEKAVHHLREQGIAKATQKAARVAKEGLIFSDVRPQERLGVLVELNCETDFVARTDDFRNLAGEMSTWIVENRPGEVTQLNESMKDRMNQTIAKLGENIAAKRFALLQRDDKSAGIIHSYVHPGDKLGVLVELKTQTDNAAGEPEFALLAKDIAMQVAATNPLVIDRDSLSPEIIEKEKDIYRTQAKNEGKPEKIIERIVQGKLEKYFQEVCLLEQAFVKDQDRSVKDRIGETQKKLDEEITVGQFVRFRLGDELA
ncbi:MAG: translation elongation factor Ts [Candidatus Zixiibacteriota bacterium]|nr:MAG: translation elongation factor Ts [candidate division Zixibacteria bacterium]